MHTLDAYVSWTPNGVTQGMVKQTEKAAKVSTEACIAILRQL